MGQYYVLFNPATYDFMALDSAACVSPLDFVSYLADRDASCLNAENYLDYLRFDGWKVKIGMVELFGLENGAAVYVGNQIARLAPDARVVHADDCRTSLRETIQRQGSKPAAVFMTCISANFPAAVAAALVLNHAGIPVILGGIHVSTATRDVDLFIRHFCPHPELVAEVRGPGDSRVMADILHDIGAGTLQREYTGHMVIEDGVWRTPPNVELLPPMTINVRGKVPLLGRLLHRKINIHPVAPFLGCPYSCSFCSVSTLPRDQRRFTLRSVEDFLAELTHFHNNKASVAYPMLLFSTDNLLLGGEVLDQMLDEIIGRKLRTPFMAQISIDIASNEKLLERPTAGGRGAVRDWL